MADGVKILTLTYLDYEELVELEVDEEGPDKDTYGEPKRILGKLRSQGWEPMNAMTSKIKFGHIVRIFFKQAEE